MSFFSATSRKTASLFFLCLALMLLAALAAFIHPWDFSLDAVLEATPSPLPTHQKQYISRYTETPVPTLPSPYLFSPSPSAKPIATPTVKPKSGGLLGSKYAWRFSDNEIFTDHTYSNGSISISWDMYRDNLTYSKPVVFFVADVLVQDITSLTTAFAKETFSAGGVKAMETIAKNNHCIVAISGDFARWHENGLIIRNGEVIRQKKFTWDLCVLYKNGVLETYEPGTISLEEIMAMDPWQSWHFGPELLDHEGNTKTKFNTSVWGRNPRSAIGYYEPGHYCLVMVDGRQRKYSNGLNMQELSQLMHTLGCVRAYNLDGGATAHMTWGNEVINNPSKDRKVHDIICVRFPGA